MGVAMIDLVQQKRDAIADLARAYGVSTLDIFGSAATGAFTEESRTSDIDFIVEFSDMSPGIANRYLDFAGARGGTGPPAISCSTDRFPIPTCDTASS